jgi:hypothetical protein
MHRFLAVLGVVALLGGCGSGDPEPSPSDTLAGYPPGVGVESSTAGMVIVPEEAPNGLEGTWRSGMSEPVDDSSAVAVEGDVLWVATEGGLVRWDLRRRSSELLTTELGFGIDHVSHVAVGPDGTVWVSSWGDRLAWFDGTRWSEPKGFRDLDITNVPRPPGYPRNSDAITAMAVGPNGVLYLAGPETLFAYDGRTWTVTPVPADVRGGFDWAMDMAVAPDGTVWVAGGDDVLSYRAGVWERFTSADGIPPGSVRSIVVAPDGDVWVAASDRDPFAVADPLAGGVGRYNGDSWVVFDESDGLYATTAEAVTAGADGTVWVVHAPSVGGAAQGPPPGRVSRFDGTAWTVTGIETAGNLHGGAAVDDSGTLWVGSGLGVIGFDGTEAIRLRVDADTRPYVEMPHTVVEGGTDVLASTTAKPAPPRATCPAGARPDVAGSFDQERPEPRVGAAAFDQESGLVIVVTDTATWTFDVCSNTWSQTSDTGVGVPGSGPDVAVYDADSDRVVAWRSAGWGAVEVYDANTETWTDMDVSLPATLDKAVYDPVSGLIVAVASDNAEMWAFDVDTDTWTQVSQGPISPPRSGQLASDLSSDLTPSISWQNLAYDADADRIVLYVTDNSYGPGWAASGIDMTWAFDLRAGLWSVEPTTNFEFGWVAASGAAYDPAVGMSVVPACGVVAGYDLSAHEWRVLWGDAADCWKGLGPLKREGHWVVHDSLNERILVGGGEARLLPETADHWAAIDDVWAFEAETSTWIELVAPSTP